MKRYTYTVIFRDQTFTCDSTREVAECCNSAIGMPLVSMDMVLNYFTRPDVVSDRMLGRYIHLWRTPKASLTTLPQTSSSSE